MKEHKSGDGLRKLCPFLSLDSGGGGGEPSMQKMAEGQEAGRHMAEGQVPPPGRFVSITGKGDF